MSVLKDMQRIIRFAESQGFVVSSTGGGHIRLVSPAGKTVTCPSTPSDYRGFANIVADLRRSGLEVPRKAPKAKKRTTMAVELYDHLPLQRPVELETRPGITAILGQWRSLSWFDEHGLPRTEEAWPGLTDKDIMAAIVLSHLDVDHTRRLGDVVVTSFVEKAEATIPRGRNLRIRFDSVKFWSAGDLYGDMPNVCTCGKTFTDPDEAMSALAAHIVNEHERGNTDHAPDSFVLKPWEDPTEIEELFRYDSFIEELIRDRKKAEEERDKIKGRFAALTKSMRAVLEHA